MAAGSIERPQFHKYKAIYMTQAILIQWMPQVHYVLHEEVFLLVCSESVAEQIPLDNPEF